QSVVALLTHCTRPELVARGIVDLLHLAGCATTAVATAGTKSEREILASFGEVDASHPDKLPRHFSIARSHDRPVDIWMQPHPDVESTATLNAIEMLLSTILDLERARTEREGRLALWPIEDVDVINEHAVVNGKMRDLMTTIKRVAGVNINVLLTGESGTGKE